MIRDLGTVHPGTLLYIPFHTFDSNDPSASVTMSGLATTDVEIYKDGSVTQRASDNGYALLDTDGTDFDGVTGIHALSIDLADNSTAGFYAAGSQYWVVIASVTVDAATVNFILCTFRIGYPNAILNTTIATLASQTSFTLTTGPAEDDALNGSVVMIHDVASAVQKGQAYILDYTGSTKTVTLAAGTTFTAATTDNVSVFPRSDMAYLLGTILSTPATAGILDVNVKNINNAAAATPGAAGGVLISGSNSGTTTLGALTVTGATIHTGNVSMAAGLNITQSSSNTSALVVTGNGTGHGGVFTSGSGATGDGIQATAASTNGNGFKLTSTGTGSGLLTDKLTASGAVAFQSTFAVTTSSSFGAISGTTVTFSGAVAFQSTFAVTTSSSFGALSCTTLTASGAVAFQSTFAVTTSTSLAALSCTTLTASGAVAFQSTFAVTTSTSLAALSASTFATSGTTTFNAFTITNATTFSGAVTGTNASNDLRVNVTKIEGTDATDYFVALDDPTLAALGTLSTDVASVQTTVDGNSTSLDNLTSAVSAVDAAVGVIDGIVDAILVDTAEIGVAGAGLTNINLPNQTMDIIGNITGNLSGSVGSVSGAVGSVTGAVGSVTGLTASDVGAIKTKTDSLTFTEVGVVDANVTHVNETEVDGVGTTLDPWGPV